jgi:exodeoxyribonuclease VII small subunit
MPDKKIADLNFEQANLELEAIVEKMEQGEQDLERSLHDFERGVALMKHCHSLLNDAEQKVEVLVKNNDGLFSTQAFEDQN